MPEAKAAGLAGDRRIEGRNETESIRAKSEERGKKSGRQDKRRRQWEGGGGSFKRERERKKNKMESSYLISSWQTSAKVDEERALPLLFMEKNARGNRRERALFKIPPFPCPFMECCGRFPRNKLGRPLKPGRKD